MTCDPTGTITFVVPVWGRYADSLPKALASIRSQGVAAEILVVDNASDMPITVDADSGAVLRLPRRVSLAAARNAGLALVRTRFVSFLDADDQLLAGAVAIMLEVFERRPRLAAVSGALVYCYPDGRRAPATWPKRPAYALQRIPLAFALYGVVHNAWSVCSGSILLTAAVRAVGSFGNTRYHEDWALSVMLSWRPRIAITRIPTALYTVDPGSRLHALSTAECAANAREVRRYVRSHSQTPLLGRLLTLALTGRKPEPVQAPTFLLTHSDDVIRPDADQPAVARDLNPVELVLTRVQRELDRRRTSTGMFSQLPRDFS